MALRPSHNWSQTINISLVVSRFPPRTSRSILARQFTPKFGKNSRRPWSFVEIFPKVFPSAKDINGSSRNSSIHMLDRLKAQSGETKRIFRHLSFF